MQSEDWLLLAQSWPPPLSAEGIAVLTPWLGNLSCRDLSHSWPKSRDPESTQPPAWANAFIPGIGWRVMLAPQVMGWDVVIGRRHHLSDEILSLLNRGVTLHIIDQRVLRGPGKALLPPRKPAWQTHHLLCQLRHQESLLSSAVVSTPRVVCMFAQLLELGTTNSQHSSETVRHRS